MPIFQSPYDNNWRGDLYYDNKGGWWKYKCGDCGRFSNLSTEICFTCYPNEEESREKPSFSSVPLTFESLICQIIDCNTEATPQLIKYILQSDVDVNRSVNGTTPLLYAIHKYNQTKRGDHYTLALLLLNNGGDVLVKDKYGVNAIDLCQDSSLQKILRQHVQQ